MDRNRLRDTLLRWNNATRGVLEVLIQSIRRYGAARGAETAASLAYYTLFSLFPFLLSLIAAGSFFLDREEIYQEIERFIVAAFPVSQDLIEQNLRTVAALRGPIGALGLLGLLWSATGVFSSLTHSINRAWPGSRPRPFLRKRLLGLGIAAAVAALLLLSALATTAASLLAPLGLPSSAPLGLDWRPFQFLLARAASWFIKVLIFALLYAWAPNRRVPWQAFTWAAVVAATGWELATAGFTWYLTSGLPRYELIYGSLGAIIVLMLWIYISMSIVLYGAHLGAAIVEYQEQGRNRILSALFE